jgi:hypothetical protein
MNDCASWMSPECLHQFDDLHRKAKRAKAQKLKKQRFNKILNDIAINKNVFFKFLQNPDEHTVDGMLRLLDWLWAKRHQIVEHTQAL